MRSPRPLPTLAPGRLAALALALVLALGASSAGAPVRVEARCALQGLAPRVLTPASISLPREGGGIVVGQVVDGRDVVALPERVELARGRRAGALVAQRLAPGLVRLVPETPLQPGPWSAGGLPGAPSLTIGRAPLPGIPTRPSVIELRRVASTGISASRTPRTEVRATLEFPIPPGVLAILVYWGEDPDAAAWSPAFQGQREAVVWSDPARCTRQPEGTRRPPSDEGAVARIAFVDALGQVSPRSEAAPIR